MFRWEDGAAPSLRQVVGLLWRNLVLSLRVQARTLPHFKIS